MKHFYQGELVDWMLNATICTVQTAQRLQAALDPLVPVYHSP